MKIKTLLTSSLCLSLVSCANNPLREYKAELKTPLQQVQSGQIKPAIAAFSNNNDDIMNRLERGSLYRMDTQYQNSLTDFDSANAYVDLWVKSYHNSEMGSVSDVAEAGLINDKVLNYQVKDYEKVMLATYQALNYLSLNHPSDARVQVMRMYQLEDKINYFRQSEYAKANAHTKSNSTPSQAPTLDKFEAKNYNAYNFDFINQPSVLRLKNSYQNAFSHYVAGFVFEGLGEYDMARPAYKRALELNPGNSLIQKSINNIDQNRKVAGGTTDLLILEEVGHAPELSSQSLNVPWVLNAGDNTCPLVLKASLPMLVVDTVDRVRPIQVDSTSYQPLKLTDVNLMEARALHDNLPNIFASNLLRIARDYAAQKEACKQGGTTADLAAVGLGQILDEADERTWVMLPSKVYFTRVNLRQGMHQVSVRMPNGTVSSVKINLNQPYQVLSLRVIGSSVYYSN